MRDRAWNRKTSIKKARRKKRITEEVYRHGKWKQFVSIIMSMRWRI